MKALLSRLRNLRFVLNLVIVITFILLLLSATPPGILPISLNLPVPVLLAIFGLVLFVRIFPTLTSLLKKAADTELPTPSREWVLVVVVLCGVVLLPLAGFFMGSLVSLGLTLFFALVIWVLLFGPIREDIDDDKLRNSMTTIGAAAMVVVAIPLQVLAYLRGEQLFAFELLLFVVWLVSYITILIIWNLNEPPPELPELVARAGHLRNHAGEEITPENWSEHKPDKKVEKNKPPDDVLELTCWPDTAVVVERDGRNPRVLMLEAEDEDNVIKAGEDLRAVVDLRNQVRVDPKVRVLTRDGVPLHIGVGAGFNILREEDVVIEVNPYPAIELAIVNAVYKASVSLGDKVNPWDTAPLELVKSALRDAVAEYCFSDLYDYEAGTTPPRQAITGKLNDPSIKDHLSSSGIQFNFAFMTDIHFDEAYDKDIKGQWVDSRSKLLDQALAMPAAEVYGAVAVKTIDPVVGKIQRQIASSVNEETIEEGTVTATRIAGKFISTGGLQLVCEGLQETEDSFTKMLDEDMLGQDQLSGLLQNIRRDRVLLGKQIRKARAQAAMAADDDDEDDVAGAASPFDAPPPSTPPEVSGLDPDAAGMLQEIVNGLRQSAKETERRAARDSREAGEKFEKLLSEMMAVLDIIDRAVATINPDMLYGNQTASAYARGFQGVQEQMVKLFQKIGLEEVPGVGQLFDSTVHYAKGVDPSSREPRGYVSRVLQRGYRYQGKLLRSASVWVSSRDESGGRPQSAQRTIAEF